MNKCQMTEKKLAETYTREPPQCFNKVLNNVSESLYTNLKKLNIKTLKQEIVGRVKDKPQHCAGLPLTTSFTLLTSIKFICSDGGPETRFCESLFHMTASTPHSANTVFKSYTSPNAFSDITTRQMMHCEHGGLSGTLGSDA